MVCFVCGQNVGTYRVGVVTVQIANHTAGGYLCPGSGVTRRTA